MDVSADLALQAILDFFSKGRSTSDFVNGIDNEALDFSQLEDFINNDNTQNNNNYFNESLNSTTTTTTSTTTTTTTSPPPPPSSTTTTTGKLLNVIIENNKRNAGHSLPESPPDSSSEHPYSPQDGCDPPSAPPTTTTTPTTNDTNNIYTTLGPTIYKTTNLISPILSDNLILGSHIVVNDANTTDQFNDQQQQQQQQNENLLQERLLLTNNFYKNDDLVHHHHQQHQQHHLNYHHGLDVAPNVPQNPALPRTNPTTTGNDLDNLPVVYTNLQNVPKKRKLSQDSPLVKSEPEHCTTSQLSPTGPLSTSIDDEYTTQSSDACLSETQYQCIRFSPFQQTQWHSLCDQNLTELPIPHYRVDADKGFNFSNADDAFVCQKKNHFQITCHVQLLGDAQFVKTQDGLQKISSFHLHFYGVKHDCPTQTIRVEQSQSDRSKKPFHPVLIELVNSQVTKVTVGRLHFSETTSNNMRKKGKPNPEQRYFQLVVGLHAHTINGNFPVISHASQKIIVRASNPGQFESDVELCWQKGQIQDSVYHSGKVGINTDRPDESLVVHGNIKITGHIIQPSDIRAKKNIVECDPRQQLRNVQKLRVVKYDYEPTIASQLNQNPQYSATGVIAQEVAEILPEAVQPAGDLLLDNGESIDNFLVVNKERIFMENIGAVKELCRVTDNLETRIDQLERINRRLNKLKRGDSLKSNSTVNSLKNSYTKCSKHHKCNEDDELCSNKFIQIVIVVLVLIMAFCLAAITTLYLLETARHNHFIQSSLQATQQQQKQQQQQQIKQQYHRTTVITKRPIKNTKNLQQLQWQQVIEQQLLQQQQQQQQRNLNTYDDLTRITLDSNLIKRPSFIIGRPLDCLTVDQDLENTNLCQIYCCAAPSTTSSSTTTISTTTTILPPPPPEFVDKNPSSLTTLATTTTIITDNNKTQLLNNSDDKVNKISRSFHSNDIVKQQLRQKRDAYDLNDEANSFDTSDDQLFTITVQGRHFNTTLTRKYLINDLNPYNFTYSIPISKYMPDEFINLIFRSTHENIREIEHCFNGYKQHECLFLNPIHYYDDDKQQQQQIRHKVNENNPSQLLKSQSIIFEVDMVDFQTKIMTYRASLRQNQSICKLSSTRAGIDFIEYNFHFYRRCDE